MVVAPQPSSGRIAELDALRGVAVIGIVWLNVLVFALPSQAYYNPLAWGGEGALDRLVWAASFVFVEDKFRTLFAMLFGAGCLILFDKGRALRGVALAWRAHYARMAVLFAIGLVHAVLFANNDILRAYALAGCALPFLAPLAPRALVAVAIGLMTIHVGFGFVGFGGAIHDWFTGRMASDASFFVERNYGTDPAAIAYMLERGQEALGERIGRRAEGIPAQLGAVALSLPLNLASIALGMALWRSGMLAGKWRLFRLQRLAAACALGAIPALLALAWFIAVNGFPGALAGAGSLVVSAPFDTLLGLAYAALAMAFFTPGGAVTRLLTPVGRLSLTNYLMTSVILASIFAPWGLGLFAAVSRVEALAISFVPIIAMLAWSPFWAARFGKGPFERLWRGASRLIG
ncbi:DUF418 domain-containing protein [Erythrobacter sp.]|uniref:DUF418 domain-containing protein n=1 Tax=Erythrobacter sp. TaxID=1042 RepID=UPI001425D746|nr:DUF418 domain-containing protein [Erythrobacter sp.]QIQ87744.1 MAG: DUF418 domain-containing protein [Erythrobacter sp.]